MIKVENLTKEYILRHQYDSRYTSLRDVIVDKAQSIFKAKPSLQADTFLALSDVSFDVKQGERVGIIGRNGAGKSTLLKVLSRIVTPTRGRVTIDGRVASLLEVGTGFHAELSGRENIFLNGAILGMTKSEIQKNFDAIVDFSGVERFLDTPVKRYSSGMYVRLAFAVAAHLEPEVLIVDEVLAVGDAEFQKKCIGKMKEVSNADGRTILFVSHNIAAIRSMCEKIVFLEGGKVVAYDKTEKVLPLYQGVLKEGSTNGIFVTATPECPSGEWETGTDLHIQISWEKYRFDPGWQCDIACYTMDGTKLFAIQSETFSTFSSLDKEHNGVEFSVKNMGFASGDLRLDVGLSKAPKEPYFFVVENCLMLSPTDKGLPEYKRNDVVIIPQTTCKAINI
jgi:ABC-type polysaccharide/polyol phosphate transport system ATPase subunit